MKITKKILGGTIALMALTIMLSTPDISFARNKYKMQMQQTGQRPCPVSAYGHLIAPGLNKGGGQPQIPTDCVLPPGIAKKVYGTQPIPVNTGQGPKMSNIMVTVRTSTD